MWQCDNVTSDYMWQWCDKLLYVTMWHCDKWLYVTMPQCDKLQYVTMWQATISDNAISRPPYLKLLWHMLKYENSLPLRVKMEFGYIIWLAIGNNSLALKLCQIGATGVACAQLCGTQQWELNIMFWLESGSYIYHHWHWNISNLNLSHSKWPYRTILKEKKLLGEKDDR